MNQTQLTMAALAAAACAALSSPPGALAAPSAIPLDNVAFSQPNGHGCAQIDYHLDEAPVIVTLDVQTNTLENGAGDWVSLGGNVVKSLSGDIGIVRTSGDHAIVWNAPADWPDTVLSGGRIRAVVTVWATNAPPDWLVVGYETAGDVRFYTEKDHVPEGVESDLYKGEKLLMRRIPAAGRIWTMGLTPAEYDNETMVPTNSMPHRVMLTKDYFMGVYELTQRQYANFTGDSIPASGSSSSNFSGYEDSWKRPVVRVRYGDFRQHLRTKGDRTIDNAAYKFYKIRQRTGGKIDFDFPTEAQWEFACRAGKTTAFNNGGSCTDADYNLVGWNGGNSSVSGTRQPHAVGGRLPNAFGLYDTHGNVFEICLDSYKTGTDYLATLATGFEHGSVTIDPEVANTGTANADSLYIVRGGTWSSTYTTAQGRSGDRSFSGKYQPSTIPNTIGIRLCCPAVFR